jgi:hypothetical protein
MENSTDAFYKSCTDNKDVCWKYFKDKSALHATPLPKKQNTLPEATWGILVIWNKAAREQLITKC